MRNKLYQILEPAQDNISSKIYDIFMMIIIVVSIVPLAFKESNDVFNVLEYITVTVFILDYILKKQKFK